MKVVPTLKTKVRDSFQPYLMAFGQSKRVSWKVFGGDGDKRDLKRRKQHTKVGEKIWGKP